MDQDQMDCERVRALAPKFVDGEMPSDDAASALRRHLIDCGECRTAVQEQTSLRQWFVPSEEVPVPAGFAARVTEMAFATNGLALARGVVTGGGAGGSNDWMVPRGSGQHGSGQRGPRPMPDRQRVTSFQVGLVTLAAAVLLAVTLLIVRDNQNHVDRSDLNAQPSIEEQLRTIDAENAAGAGEESTER